MELVTYFYWQATSSLFILCEFFSPQTSQEKKLTVKHFRASPDKHLKLQRKTLKKLSESSISVSRI